MGSVDEVAVGAGRVILNRGSINRAGLAITDKAAKVDTYIKEARLSAKSADARVGNFNRCPDLVEGVPGRDPDRTAREAVVNCGVAEASLVLCRELKGIYSRLRSCSVAEVDAREEPTNCDVGARSGYIGHARYAACVSTTVGTAGCG